MVLHFLNAWSWLFANSNIHRLLRHKALLFCHSLLFAFDNKSNTIETQLVRYATANDRATASKMLQP